jgi:hypothetical protein
MKRILKGTAALVLAAGVLAGCSSAPTSGSNGNLGNQLQVEGQGSQATTYNRSEIMPLLDEFSYMVDTMTTHANQQNLSALMADGYSLESLATRGLEITASTDPAFNGEWQLAMEAYQKAGQALQNGNTTLSGTYMEQGTSHIRIARMMMEGK